MLAADVASASRAGAQSLAARRKRRLAELLSSTVRDSRLYRRLLKGRDPAAWSLNELPIARKSELRDFDDWVTDPEVRLDELRRFTADRARIGEPYLGRYVVWESSGSSGKPGIFVQDTRSMAVYDSLEALRRPPTRSLRRLLDPFYLSERIVFIGATSGHFASTITMRRLRRLNRRCRTGSTSCRFCFPSTSWRPNCRRCRRPSSPPIPVPQCCWPKNVSQAGLS
jgi:phenylacetate-coenzyme A ligase PaaK-like adenylate-forming protein